MTFLGSVITGILDGAKVTAFNPSRFSRLGVEMGLEVELKKPESDDLGRLQLVIGEPSGGVFDQLPDNIRLYHKERSSPVRIASLMKQRVQLRLDLNGLDVVYYPFDQIIENDAGCFSITVGKAEDRITITRELELTRSIYQPEEWPALRALLLADRHERNQTLLVKTAEDNDENGKKAAKE